MMKIARLCIGMALQLFPVGGLAFAQATTLPAERHIPAVLDDEGKQAVAGTNRFTLDLYKRLLSPSENVFVSPASVSTAIGLAYRGANGATANELQSTLHYSASPQIYLAADASVLKTLNFSGEGRELHVSNALWIQQGLPLRADFLADVQTYAQAGLHRVDYQADPDGARQTINRWVAAATNDRIKDLLHVPDVKATTRAALVNSIYWKGRWDTGFYAAETRLELFAQIVGKRVMTPLMHREASFQSVERDGVKAIQLPYVFREVAMVVLMPNSASALPHFEEGLTAEKLMRWISDLDGAYPRDTVLTLPKMHLEWRGDLVETLKALGAKTAFGDEADFSGMAIEPYPGEVLGAIGLKIKKVIHQTYLDVDERGSEAAAATAVMMDVVVTGRRIPPPPPPFIFRADKPFLFLLVDKRTNLILFIGRYVAPPQR
jgi:serpin B